jgi:hypothetical protein
MEKILKCDSRRVIKYDHSPLDYSVFSVLYSSLFGLIFSLSMFHKSLEPSKFCTNDKLRFIGRNILVIGTLHGLNQYMNKFLLIPKNRKKMKNWLRVKNEIVTSVLASFISSTLPTYLAMKIYFYKNKNILIEKNFFIWYVVIIMMFDLINSENKKF